MKLLCLFFGHNKILEVEREGEGTKYFDTCSQCNKKWLISALTVQPIETSLENQNQKNETPQETILVQTPMKINLKKKSSTNFYTL